MSTYLTGFTVACIGCRHELEQWASAKTTAAVQQLDKDIAEHNSQISEIARMTVALASGEIPEDPVTAKQRTTEEPITFGPSALELHERKAGLLAPLKNDFDQWLAGRREVLEKKRKAIWDQLAAMGLRPGCSEGEAVIRNLAAAEIRDAFQTANVLTTIDPAGSQMFFERSAINNATRMSLNN